MELLPALGLIALLLVKEAGLPVPVPGDLLVLGAGIAAAGAAGAEAAGAAASVGAAASTAGASTVPALLLIGAILLAGVAGGCIQFALVRGAFREPLLGVLTRFGVPRDRLDGLAAWLRQRGATGVAVARATPGVRVGATAASGLAALPFVAFLPGLVAGNTVFVGGHFVLGYVAGPAALSVIAGSGAILLATGAFVALAVLGAVGWRSVRQRRARLQERRDLALHQPGADGIGQGIPSDLASVAAWTEAACPACLVVSLARRGA